MSGPFSLGGTVLLAALQGAVEGAAGKLTEGPAGLLLEKVRVWLGGAPRGSIEAAVERAVGAAARKAEKASPSLLVRELMQDRTFVEEVARDAVFDGDVDLERVQAAYLALPGAAGRAAPALETGLRSFFKQVRRELDADPDLGPRLGQTRLLAAEAELKVEVEQLREYSRQAVEHLEQLAASSLRAEAQREAQLEVTIKSEEHLERLVRRAGAGPLDELTAPERLYLERVFRESAHLPLAVMGGGVAKAPERQLRLEDVFVDLATTSAPGLELVFDRLAVPTTKRPEVVKRLQASVLEGGRQRITNRGGDLSQGLSLLSHHEWSDEHPLAPWASSEEGLAAASAPLSAIEALANQRLVLLGAPGSGKSSFVNYLSLLLAAAWAQPETVEAAKARELFEDRPPFPLRIPLRRWNKGLAEDGGEGLERLYAALPQLTTGVSKEQWIERLDRGDTLVLFDGLDEVPVSSDEPARDHRRWVLAAIEELARVHGRARVVVSCRVKPYQTSGYQLPGWPTFELAPLDEARIRRFLKLWYDRLYELGWLDDEQMARDRRQRLERAWTTRTLPPKLFERPLLLTMLAAANSDRPLPDGIAELYERCIEQLLWRWEERITEGGGVESLASLLQRAKLEKRHVETALRRLAYFHLTPGEEAALIEEVDFKSTLAAEHPDPEVGGAAWAGEVFRLVREREGLIVVQDDRLVSFPHKSFQEFLAALWLLDGMDPLSQVRQLATVEGWREVLAFAFAHLASKSRELQLLALLGELTAAPHPQELRKWQRILAAGQGWLALGPSRSSSEGIKAELGERISRLLTEAMQHSELPAAQRLEAGEILADLGILPADLGTFVEIPADLLPYAFKIGRYPVTNCEYREFVEATGGQEPFYWPEPRFSRATLPVVAMTWDDALAYCAWRTARLRAEGRIGAEEVCTLPTVVEWQRAARGVEGRRYPWGESAESFRSNSRESGLERATPVHMYPQGASPEGVCDLAGSVWEWTADGDERYTEEKVLIGGAWWSGIENVGPAARYRILPLVRFNSIGFRLVVVPSSRRRSDS